MEMTVRAVDVGYGNTKYVTGISGDEIRCASFPSLAYPFPRDPSATLGADRRKTVAIPIGGMFYEVGPDVMLAADAFRASQMHDGYIDTPEYLALTRGALRMMKVDTIDLLVVGLPVVDRQRVTLRLDHDAVDRAGCCEGRRPLGEPRHDDVAMLLVAAVRADRCGQRMSQRVRHALGTVVADQMERREFDAPPDVVDLIGCAKQERTVNAKHRNVIRNGLVLKDVHTAVFDIFRSNFANCCRDRNAAYKQQRRQDHPRLDRDSQVGEYG